MNPPELVLDIHGLTRRFGDRVAVDDLSLAVPAGSVCGLVGPNGAGKTTTIRLLLGLLRPDSGEGTVLGLPITDPAAYLPRVGALIEGPAFYPGLTGRENLTVLARLSALDGSHVERALRRVELADRADDRYKAYSLGMKQRLGIAAALLGDPDLVFLDEPTNGLDPAGIREMRGLMAALAQDGTTVLVSSHLLSEVGAVCDHVVVMARGSLRYSGRVEDLAGDAPRISLRAEDPADLAGVAALATEMGYPGAIRDDDLVITAPAAQAGELNRRAMLEGITLVRIEPHAMDLEDAFFSLTGAA